MNLGFPFIRSSLNFNRIFSRLFTECSHYNTNRKLTIDVIFIKAILICSF